MQTDRHGNPLAYATPEAAAFFDRAVDALNVYRGDPLALADAAIEASPDFTMAHVLRAWLLAFATEPEATNGMRRTIEVLKELRLPDREASHLAALADVASGNWNRAATRMDRHNADYPRDMLGLQSGHLMDFFRCNSRNLRDRIARSLPHWSEDDPGYSVLLGMYAFGLEESGDYRRAEETGRRAVAGDPRDCWGHHAVAHVMEMEGRAADGIGWMIAREPHWATDDNSFKVHNWWHRALFHLDLGQVDEVLTLYDGPVRGDRSAIALELIDASALLWRLEIAGHDVGDRWREVSERWDAHADGRTYPFNDWHAAMAYLATGREREVERLAETIRTASDASRETAKWARETGLPLIEGFAAFRRGDYETAVALLHGARSIANSFGGSHAQRDIIDWTMTEAAIRGGMTGLARALANERIARKPHSGINREFFRRCGAAPASRLEAA